MMSSRRLYVELNNDRPQQMEKPEEWLGPGQCNFWYCLTSTQMTSFFMTEPGTISMRTIYVSQYPSFTVVEHIIEETLDELTTHYRSNSLRDNPDKTHVMSFHLKNREAKRTLKVTWNNTHLENTSQPMYRSVTLDRTLSYKEHIHRTKMKVATRNNLLKKFKLQILL